MVASKKAHKLIYSTYSKGIKMKQVNCLQCLGYSVKSGGRCDTEMKIITVTNNSITKMSHVMRNGNAMTSTKICLLKSCVWSVLYGYKC